MFCEVKTRNGTIGLDKAVLGYIIRREADAFQGKVLLSNAKGKPIGDAVGFFDCVQTEADAFELRVFVVLQFGVSINEVTRELIRRIRAQTETMIGVRASRVVIAVRGMLSKNISRRDLEIVG
ncbi:MAG: Asp23/Gls24 family envelope stress response protein [Clostridiales Family XIII bacterium]|jgi:uncharacterized alkaline shock family protein YloU|nr:Asp23/Gls24 family envelope stress response protein [Clostridiales Family XIII bacterium]